MRSFPTVDDRLREGSGFSSGFDYLRIVLAVGVFTWHTFPLCYGDAAASAVMQGPWGAVVRLILPMFFSLSGFLVAASIERSPSLGAFLGLRALRIVPALFVEIVLSALVLGPLLTLSPLRDYFSNREFYSYFLNVVGFIHYELPGVFAGNPYPNVVNGSLWTVPWELECYIALAGLALLKIAPRRIGVMIAALLFGTIAVLAWNSYRGIVATGEAVPGRTLVLYFLAAVTIYMARRHIPYRFGLFVASVLLSVVLMLADKSLYLSPLPLAYATIYLGLQRPKRNAILLSGDYSYGIYLYAFPLQQMIVARFTTHWYVLFPATCITVFAFAAFSWHFIEKPLLRLKRLLKSPASGSKPRDTTLIAPVCTATNPLTPPAADLSTPTS